MDEYEFYLLSKYLPSGKTTTRVLTAEEAKTEGLEDGMKYHDGDATVYVDGFDSRAAIDGYIKSLYNASPEC